ncbi:hypothetical protein Pr1d_41960 [Bythopirellula goksoeyrii]|uniref:DUF1365 domain-containing protein n=2 Tax=Bythopirellula goksoeyrii TaxID=1400387 RepID=A0A5B9QG27_9BACT|nr:hypothetical protein Pr1d_41960 [Bythopirellula goksoeyrii]
MAYLDLAEVSALRQGLRLFGASRWGPACFLESDHMQTEAESLQKEIRACLKERSGMALSGPIRLLTLLRCWRYYFSPLNLYYVFNADDTQVEAIVAEVSNTPWRETHRYVLVPEHGSNAELLAYQHPKEFHVSPFMDMDVLYQWMCSIPSETLQVQINSIQTNNHFFTANLELRKRDLTDREIARALLQSPWASARIVTSIYWQALLLWWKRCPFFPHPNKRETQTNSTVE